MPALAALALVVLAAACSDGGDTTRPSSTSRATTSTRPGPGATTADPTAVRLEEFATGLAEPVAITTLAGSVFVAERAGRIVRLDGADHPVVLDISARTESGYLERGLLGGAQDVDARDVALQVQRVGDAHVGRQRVLERRQVVLHQAHQIGRASCRERV